MTPLRSCNRRRGARAQPRPPGSSARRRGRPRDPRWRAARAAMLSARDVILQVAQVAAALLLSPLLQGIILQLEERVQRGQGPGIFQPYRDLRKLFHKQLVVPVTASGIYWAAPIVAFTCMLTVPIL